MKKLTLILSFIVYLLTGTGNSYSQCTPDTVTCKDTLEPGQVCPEVLPDGFLGIPYNQTVTILPPSSATLSGYPITIPIVKIRIESIENLPPGIVYEVNALDLYPDSAYCVLLSGIPSQTGEFNIAITVIPYIDILGTVTELPAVVNDTSVKIIIYEPTGIKNNDLHEFDVINNQPNPFNETTKIGFLTNKFIQYNLNIYNYLGMLIYSETIDAKPGENIFRFTGESLSPGYYLYFVTDRQTFYSAKLIKSR